MIRTLLLAGAALAMLSAPAALAGSNPPAIHLVATMAAPTAQEFVTKASGSNMFEIESSQIAVGKAESPDVKAFAERMIADHTKAGEEMKAAVQASNAGLTMPTAMDTEHQAKLTTLSAATGADLDTQYVQMQVAAHDEAVALFTAYAEGGDNPALKAFAEKTLPTLKEHQMMIHKMAGMPS
jgi:putative membrane protein